MANEMNNILFVQEVEKNPCLYNYNLPEYSRKDLVEKTWTKVGQKFKITGPQCKEKWRNIRSVFVRNLKPAKSGSSAKKKKPYYLQEVLQFALPYIKLNDSSISGNLPVLPIDQRAVEDDRSTDGEGERSILETGPAQPTSILDEILTVESQSIRSMPYPSEQSTLHSPSPEPRPASTSSSFLNPTRPRPKKRAKQCDVESKIIEYLNTKKTKNVQELENNPRKMFLLSLLPEVEQMKGILDNTPSDSENSQITLHYETVAEAFANPENNSTIDYVDDNTCN